MKKNLILLLFCLVAFSFAVQAQTASTETPKYAEILKKLQDGDTKIDYKALRMAYTKTDDYSAYGINADKRASMFKALENKKYKDALKIADEVLKTNYTEMNAHFVSSVANEGLKETAKSEFHKKVFFGLINSILNGADGKSANTAYVVISVPEEYVVIAFLGLERTKQALVEENGSKYDILTVVNPDKNEPFKLYFNIDIVFKGYEKILGK